MKSATENENKFAQQGKGKTGEPVENELINTPGFFHNIIDCSIDAIVVSDIDGNIIDTNKAFLGLIGYTEEEEISGRSLQDFLLPSEGVYETTTGNTIQIDKDDFLKTKTSLRELKKSGDGKLMGQETYYLRRDHKIIPAEQNINFIYDDKGKKIGSVAIIRNISERKIKFDKIIEENIELTNINRKLEQEIERANKLAVMAEIASFSKSEFMANLSHEIRTPLNAIMGFSEILLDTKIDPEQNDYLRTINESGDILSTIINDIFDFTKIEAGNIDFESLEFDLELLVYNVCEIIRPKIGSKPVELLCSISDNVPAEIKGDPHRVRQVLVNLLGNALKFTEAGEIELSLDVDEEQNDRIKIHVKVRDTGIGIPKKKLETVFDAFMQADNSTTRKFGGTGLGLAICKKISNLMHGDVWAESRKNKGSAFHFTAWLEKSKKSPAKRIYSASLQNKKILIVDDNRTNLNILSRYLEYIGIQAYTLSNGEKICETLEDACKSSAPFDLFVLNLQMTGVEGYDMPKIINELNIPKICLLAFSSNIVKDAKRCQEAGFNGYLPKPIKRNKFLKMIKHLLCDDDSSEEKTRENKIATQYSITEDAKISVNILLAEDNPVNQKLTFTMLKKAGYNVEVANNGKEVVKKYLKEPEKFDLIFMDLQMPELDGLSASKEIRNMGFTSVPIVAMTANVMKSDRESCLEAGMNDFVDKPIKRYTVFEIIRKWVLDR